MRTLDLSEVAGSIYSKAITEPKVEIEIKAEQAAGSIYSKAMTEPKVEIEIKAKQAARSIYSKAMTEPDDGIKAAAILATSGAASLAKQDKVENNGEQAAGSTKLDASAVSVVLPVEQPDAEPPSFQQKGQELEEQDMTGAELSMGVWWRKSPLHSSWRMFLSVPVTDLVYEVEFNWVFFLVKSLAKPNLSREKGS
jgi:hypothetical protein